MVLVKGVVTVGTKFLFNIMSFSPCTYKETQELFMFFWELMCGESKRYF